MKKLQKNIYLYYVISFLSACIFTTPIWAFFFTSYLQFSFSTALNLVILAGIVSFLLEIPSGSWADRYGRKKLFVIGVIFSIISFSIWTFSTTLIAFIIAGIIQGISISIMSGNFEALIHDVLEKQKQTKKYKGIQSNAYIGIFLGRTISSLTAGFLFIISPLFPIYATIISYFLILILLVFVKESKQNISSHTNTKNHIKEGIQFIFSNSQLLYFIIIISLSSGLANIYWFSYQPYLKEIGINIVGVGIVFAITGIFSAIGAHLIEKIQDVFSTRSILIIITGAIFFSSIFLQWFSINMAIAGIIIISIIFGFLMSFGNTVLINRSPKSHKSTVLSIFSFSITIGYTSCAILSGYLIEIFGLYLVYFGNIILLFLLFLFTIIYYPRYKNP